MSDQRTIRPLRFYVHSRQPYADKVPIANVDEILIGDYRDDGTPGDDGEFRIVLIDLDVSGRWGLHPHLEAFGDATGSLRRAINAGLLDVLAKGPVHTTEAFVSRLVNIGMVEATS